MEMLWIKGNRQMKAPPQVRDGTITRLSSDGENVTFSVSKNADADTLGLPPNSTEKDGDGTGEGNENNSVNGESVPLQGTASCYG